MLSFIYFPVSLGLTISKNTGSDQKALYESMHPLGEGFFCCNAANWGKSLLFVRRGWPCWTDPLSALASLGESTALGKWMEKIANSLVHLTECPVGFGQRWWYKGPFAYDPWALQREKNASKANWKIRWEIPVEGTSTAYCLLGTTQRNCPPCFCILLCKTCTSLLSPPTWDKRKQNWIK